jgi:hypothetical protein
MPAEVRYVVFSRDEVASAIEHYGRGIFPGFPSGSIVEMETIGDEDPCIRVLVREQAAQLAQIDINAHELLSFMIRACRNARVPLPARVPKRLCMLKGSLAIAMMFDQRRYRAGHA